MVKRKKRLKKTVDSLKEQIEKHFRKLEADIERKNGLMGRYHIKEIEKSLIEVLKEKMELLGDVDDELVDEYKKRLKEIEGAVDSID